MKYISLWGGAAAILFGSACSHPMGYFPILAQQSPQFADNPAPASDRIQGTSCKSYLGLRVPNMGPHLNEAVSQITRGTAQVNALENADIEVTETTYVLYTKYCYRLSGRPVFLKQLAPYDKIQSPAMTIETVVAKLKALGKKHVEFRFIHEPWPEDESGRRVKFRNAGPDLIVGKEFVAGEDIFAPAVADERERLKRLLPEQIPYRAAEFQKMVDEGRTFAVYISLTRAGQAKLKQITSTAQTKRLGVFVAGEVVYDTDIGVPPFQDHEPALEEKVFSISHEYMTKSEADLLAEAISRNLFRTVKRETE